MRQAVFPAALADAVKATGFSPAVRAGDFLFLTGATGGAADGTMPDNAKDQTRNALTKMLTILSEVQASEADVVEITSYHTDIDADFADVETIINEVFTAPLPAWTAVEVAKLRRPGAVVELRIVVHAPPTRASQT